MILTPGILRIILLNDDMKSNQWSLLVLCIARIWSILSLGFLIFMLVGHLVGEIHGSEDGVSQAFQNGREIVMFICFPVSTIVGLALAWRWEGVGGVMTLLGMLGLFIIRPDLVFQTLFLILPAPAVLFLVYVIMARRSA